MTRKTKTRKTRSDKGQKRTVQLEGFGALPLAPIILALTPIIKKTVMAVVKSKFVQDLIKDVAVGAAEAFVEKKIKT